MGQQKSEKALTIEDSSVVWAFFVFCRISFAVEIILLKGCIK